MYRKMAWLLALALPASLGRAAPAPEPMDDGRIYPLPGGVASADGTRGFVANADGAVAALDLETGKVLWESKTVGRPVAVEGGRVLVQTRDPKEPNTLRVVSLDADKGDKVQESDLIVCPRWVSSREGDWGPLSFHSSVRLDKGDLWLMWQADAGYWGGEPPTPEKLKAATKHADGAVHVHLDSGKVEMLPAVKAPPPPPPAVKVSKALESKAARQYPTPSHVTEARVVTAGEYAVAVDVEQRSPTTVRVTLRRWDLATEKEREPIVLAADGPYWSLPIPSAGLVLIREEFPAGAPEAKTAWTAYSLETGKEVGRVPFEGDSAEVTVIGPRAFSLVRGPLDPGGPLGTGVQQRTLKAADLKTGKRLWQRRVEGEIQPPPPPP